jgi:electron transfer DM13
VRAIGRSFSAHPARLGSALFAVATLSVIAWYLGSPLFVRTYRNDELPSLAPTADASARSATGVSAAPSATSVAALVLRSGELTYVDAIHNGKGPVLVVDVGGRRFVRFADVMLTNAPDVHVYLSRQTGGGWDEGTSLYLGPLKATNGSFNYEVPEAADVASYQSIVVWCRAFRTLITWADLRAA